MQGKRRLIWVYPWRHESVGRDQRVLTLRALASVVDMIPWSYRIESNEAEHRGRDLTQLGK